MLGSESFTPSISEKLAEERRALLDLGLRNPLINFRPSKSKGVNFTGEHSTELFDDFVNQNKTLGFLTAAAPEDNSLTKRSPTRGRKHDFQTEHPEKNLQARLLKTYRCSTLIAQSRFGRRQKAPPAHLFSD